MKCRRCGKEIEKGKSYYGFCSYHCYSLWRKFHKEPNCVCPICGKSFFVKQSLKNRISHKVCCSKECSAKYRSIWFSGSGNHQYGLLGELNPTFKSNEKKSVYGYILVNSPNHPFKNGGGFVFKHRLVVEENADKFDDKYFVEIDGKKYLSPKYEVHHINENRIDNRIENLMILTKGEHRAIHNRLHPRQRNELGQFI